MNTADGIQLLILIVAIASMYSMISKEKKSVAVKEGHRDAKISLVLEEITQIKKDMKTHTHHHYESKFTEWEGRCQLREQHVDQIVKTLGIKVNDHLEIIKDLKKAIEPIIRIETSIDLMSKLLHEKLGHLASDHNKLEHRVENIEHRK